MTDLRSPFAPGDLVAPAGATPSAAGHAGPGGVPSSGGGAPDGFARDSAAGSGAGRFGPAGGSAFAGPGPFGPAGVPAAPRRSGPGQTAFGPPGGDFAGASGSAFGRDPAGSAWGRAGPTGTEPAASGGGPSRSAWGRAGPTGTKPAASASAFGGGPAPFGPHGTAFAPPSDPSARAHFDTQPDATAGGAGGRKRLNLPPPAPVPQTLDDLGESTPEASAVRAPAPRRGARARTASASRGGGGRGRLVAVGATALLLGALPFGLRLRANASERLRATSDARRTARRLLGELDAGGSPTERLARAQEAVEAAARWRERAPDSPEASAALADAYLAVAGVHTAQRHWLAADAALARAAALAVDAQAVDAARAQRVRAEAEHRAELLGAATRLLEALEEKRLPSARAEQRISQELRALAGQAPEVCRALLERLRRATAVLRAAEAETYRAALEPFDGKASPPLPRLEEALASIASNTLTRAARKPPAALAEASRRLLAREKVLAEREGRRPVVRAEQLVARRQRAAFAAWRQTVRSVCAALGRARPSDELFATADAYLGACADPLLAVPVGALLAEHEDQEPARELLQRALLRYGAPGPFLSHLARGLPSERRLTAKGQGPDASRRQALFLLARGRPVKAQGYYQRALRLRAGDPHLLGEHALAQLLAGSTAATIRAECDQALERDPGCLTARLARATVALAQGNGELAKQDLEAALALDPENPVLLARFGTALLALGDPDGARRALETAIALDPEEPAAWIARARAWLAARRPWAAVADASQGVALGDPRALRVRAEALRAAHRYPEALADIDLAIRLAPNDAALRATRGWLRLDARSYTEALADFTEALRLTPDVPEYIDGKGRCYEALKKHRAAIAEYTKAIQKNQHDAFLYGARGRVYLNLAQMERSLTDLNRAIELDPQRASFYRLRGQAFTLKLYTKEALADLNRAIELEPDNAAGYKLRGDLFNLSGKPDQALADYTKAAELDPYNAQALESRGVLRAQRGDFEAALRDLDAALRADPGYLRAYVSRGSILLKREDWQGAKADYDRAIARDPSFADPYFFRARCKERLGDPSWKADLRAFVEKAGPKHPLTKRARALLRAARRRRSPAGNR
ncbi:MAG: tetratricopeptide repeat protein [Planctomycetota bacterium]|nr:MAG: tetratricopeptide repeat protein [Planctomycetota bacterium]